MLLTATGRRHMKRKSEEQPEGAERSLHTLHATWQRARSHTHTHTHMHNLNPDCVCVTVCVRARVRKRARERGRERMVQQRGMWQMSRVGLSPVHTHITPLQPHALCGGTLMTAQSTRTS